jgi:hypothetical protein
MRWSSLAMLGLAVAGESSALAVEKRAAPLGLPQKKAACECPRPACPGKTPAIAATRPYYLSGKGALGFGVFFSSYIKGEVSVGRRLWNRVVVESSFRFGGNRDLLVLEGTLLAGLLLHLSGPVDLVLAWRAGYAGFRLSMGAGRLWAGGLAASAIVEVRWALSEKLELQVAPLVGTGYWNEIWGVVVEPAAGVAYRF